MTVAPRNRTTDTDEMVRFWTVSAAVTGLVFALSVLFGDDSFERFFGRIPPLVVIALVAVTGARSLRVLAYRGWLPDSPIPVARLHLLILVGVAAALPAVVFDTWIHFPEDMNTAWPDSLLFYPAMALVAVVLFYLAPLALLLTVLRWPVDPRQQSRRRVVGVFVAVAVLEMLFHTADVLSGSDRRLAFFVVPQLAAVGVCQLAILRRYGFAATLSFRLGYYLIWHIVWGDARLDLLF